VGLFSKMRLRRQLARMLQADAARRLPGMDERDRRLADLFIKYRIQSSHLPYPAVRIHANVQVFQRDIERMAAVVREGHGRGLARAREIHRATVLMEDLQKELARLLDRVTTPSIRQNGHVLTPIEWHSRMMQRQAETGQEPEEGTFDPMAQVEIAGAGADGHPEPHDAEMLLLLGIGPVAVGKLGTEVDPSLQDVWNAGDGWTPQER